MKILQGFAVLLCAQAAGEVLARLLKGHFGWALPGPVIGMVLLCVCLLVPMFQKKCVTAVGQAAQVLLAHLSLLFVPVGVGVMAHLSLLNAYGWKLALVLVLSTWAGLATTALVLHALWPARSSAAQER
jgi:holin-like protein